MQRCGPAGEVTAGVVDSVLLPPVVVVVEAEMPVADVVLVVGDAVGLDEELQAVPAAATAAQTAKSFTRRSIHRTYPGPLHT